MIIVNDDSVRLKNVKKESILISMLQINTPSKKKKRKITTKLGWCLLQVQQKFKHNKMNEG